MQDFHNAVFNKLVMILNWDLALCTYFIFIFVSPILSCNLAFIFFMYQDRSEKFVYFVLLLLNFVEIINVKSVLLMHYHIFHTFEVQVFQLNLSE